MEGAAGLKLLAPARANQHYLAAHRTLQLLAATRSLGAVLHYLAALEIDHWRQDAQTARLVAGAVENDHV